MCTPMMGEMLNLQREPENEHDRRAVCVLKSGGYSGRVRLSATFPESFLDCSGSI